MFRPPLSLLPVFALLALVLPGPAGAQVEKILDTVTDWQYAPGASQSAITNAINGGMRPFQIKRVGSNHDVVMVRNTGIYEVPGFGTGNMHYNRSFAQLSGDLTGRRLVSLDCYESAGQLRMSAISIPNSGAHAAGWGWLVGQSRQDIIDWVNNSSPPLRIIDLSIYTVGGQKYYSAVAVVNQGAQFQNWWWYFDRTQQEIADLLQQNNARLLDIELETPPGIGTPARFAVVMVAQNPGAGWFHGALTQSQITGFIEQNAGRITNLHRYATASGSTRFAVSLVDNAEPQTRRMRNLMANQATQGTYGFKLKRVGGPVLASLYENFVFEPASTMKIVHSAYAVRQAASGAIGLGDQIFVPNRCTHDQHDDWYWNNVCPDDEYNCNSGHESLGWTIDRVMKHSHNGRTRTLEELFNRNALNLFLQLNGLQNTAINHTLGCLCGNDFNTTTAADMVAFYEQISNGTHFGSSWRGELFSRMINTAEYGYGVQPNQTFYHLRNVIVGEVSLTDLTSAERLAFQEQLLYVYKAGSYHCGDTYYRSQAGWVSIPFKVNINGNWITVQRVYTLATFVHAGTDWGSQVAYRAAEELIREQIREALATWDAACSPGIAQHPSDVTVDEGQNAQFTVADGGAGEAEYQWQRQVGSSWATVVDAAGQYSGATTSTLTVISAEPDQEGAYRCRVIKICGTVTSNAATLTVIPAGATSAPQALPTHLVLHAPAPNPFNPQVTLRFELPRQTDHAVLEIFDVAGRKVRTLAAWGLAAGPHEFTWNGTDASGRRLASGMYLARLRAGAETATQRVMMVE